MIHGSDNIGMHEYLKIITEMMLPNDNPDTGIESLVFFNKNMGK